MASRFEKLRKLGFNCDEIIVMLSPNIQYSHLILHPLPSNLGMSASTHKIFGFKQNKLFSNFHHLSSPLETSTFLLKN